MSRQRVVALALAGSFVLGSCTLPGTTGAAPEDDARPVSGSRGPDLVEGMRDGTWPVAEVGEIEFELTDRGLELVEMRPSSGWEVVDEEVGPEQLEIDLRGPGVRTTVEVGYQSGILEIEIDQSFDPPPDGPLRLGDAGPVELVVDGGSVAVGEVTLGDGWRETRRSDDDQDAELGLRRTSAGVVETWEVDARMDDGGLEVHTDYEIQGLASP